MTNIYPSDTCCMCQDMSNGYFILPTRSEFRYMMVNRVIQVYQPFFP